MPAIQGEVSCVLFYIRQEASDDLVVRKIAFAKKTEKGHNESAAEKSRILQ